MGARPSLEVIAKYDWETNVRNLAEGLRQADAAAFGVTARVATGGAS
jgi:hypothetical protein